MHIETVDQSQYPQLLTIWEASVRATHDFLAEADLLELKPLILEQYFAAVDLRAAKGSDGELLGFCGVSDGNIEMLFIAPEARGQGVGARLTAYAIEHQGATKVDVNEQNVQALGFYEHVGFAAGRWAGQALSATAYGAGWALTITGVACPEKQH